MANIAYPVSCPSCGASAGEFCLTGHPEFHVGPRKKSTENHKPRVRAAEEYNARLDTPDTETADEFSEDRDSADDMTLDELADAIEHAQEDSLNAIIDAGQATLWEQIPASEVRPGMVVRKVGAKDSDGGTVAGRRVATWVTALDEDLRTLLYVRPDETIEVRRP